MKLIFWNKKNSFESKVISALFLAIVICLGFYLIFDLYSYTKKLFLAQANPLESNEPSLLYVEPSSLSIEIKEGELKEMELLIGSRKSSEVMFNIYKYKENEDQTIDEFIADKLAEISSSPSIDEIIERSSASGAPWLSIYPLYGSLTSSNNTTQFRLTINASYLKAGQYTTNLIVLGTSVEEKAVIPVVVNVRGTPRISLESIKIDDGFSSGTKGNRNNVADPGELINLKVFLTNYGSKEGRDLKVQITSDDLEIAKIKSNDIVSISSIDKKAQASVQFLIEISQSANSSIPPTVSLVTSDIEGNEWYENFYLGEEGKFEYPTGEFSF